MREKSTRIDLRVTPSEKETLVKAAAVAGVSVSQFLLGVLAGDNLGKMIKEFRK